MTYEHRKGAELIKVFVMLSSRLFNLQIEGDSEYLQSIVKNL